MFNLQLQLCHEKPVSDERRNSLHASVHLARQTKLTARHRRQLTDWRWANAIFLPFLFALL